MAYGELYLPPERPQKDAKTGRFLPGIVPHNKGKSWGEWMDGRKHNRVRRIAMRNLQLHPHHFKKGEKPVNCRKVVGVFDDGRWVVYPDAVEASKCNGGNPANIRRTCRWNRDGVVNKRNGNVRHDYKCNGVVYYYEDDDTWLAMIESQK